jgi:hypothetical protein
VDVEWLEVWVQLAVRGRDGQYREADINRVFIVWIRMNT